MSRFEITGTSAWPYDMSSKRRLLSLNPIGILKTPDVSHRCAAWEHICMQRSACWSSVQLRMQRPYPSSHTGCASAALPKQNEIKIDATTKVFGMCHLRRNDY